MTLQVSGIAANPSQLTSIAASLQPYIATGAAATVAFSTTWTTSGTKDMGDRAISGPLAIVSDDTGSIVGGSNQCVFIGNGTNNPTFDGAVLPNFNVTAGVRNGVALCRVGGSKFWIVLSGAGAAVSGPSAPTVIGAFPGGTVGVAYDQVLATVGFVGAITATLGSGSLPAGLALSVTGTNIRLSGTPTTAATSTFVVHAVGATSGTDDSDSQSVAIAAAAAGTLQFGASTYTVAEGGGTLTIPVTRTGGASGPASVAYATANGTATAGSDYVAATGTLNWGNGDAAAKNIVITITQDTAVEGPETFTVGLSGATGASLGVSATTVTITDDDVSSSTIPRLTTITGLAESGDDTVARIYTGTTGGVWGGQHGVATLSLPAGTDGYIRGKVTSVASSAGQGMMLGFSLSATDDDYTHWLATMLVYLGNRYTALGSGGSVLHDGSIAPAINDQWEIRRTGTSILFGVSTDGGSTFTNQWTATGQSTAKLYVHGDVNDAGILVILPGGGLT